MEEMHIRLTQADFKTSAYILKFILQRKQRLRKYYELGIIHIVVLNTATSHGF